MAKISTYDSKTTPVDADSLVMVDSAASNVTKRLTWANLKATLNTLYQSIHADLTALVAAFTPASASGPASLAFAEDTDNGAHAVTLKAPASVAANVDVELPGTAGTLMNRLASTTDNAPARYDSTTGLLQDTTNLTIGDTGKIIFGNGLAAIDQITWFTGYSDGIGSGTRAFTTAAGGEYEFRVNLTEKFRIKSEGQFALNRTITAGGTTGNQTINKPAGRVNFAAAATALTVTNSLVDANSLIFVAVQSNDTTAVIKNVVPGAGSFVITLNAAATAETKVAFWVIN